MALLVKSIADMICEQGADVVNDVIASFSCRYNDEIDDYLRNRVIDFTRKSMTMTHLVFETETGLCVGYFALTHKPLTLDGSKFNNTQRKRIERFARLDDETGCYTVSAFLIAQIGKNYLAQDGELISGVALLDLAKDELLVAKQKIGGQIVFVEMEHGNEQLAKFYADNGFVPFGSRDDIENGKPITYDQLFLFLK